MSAPHYWLHLQTRCGCSRKLSNGSTPPPREWSIPLADGPRERDARTRVLVNLAGPDEPPATAVRTFRLVSFSGDREHGGTGLYEEV